MTHCDYSGYRVSILLLQYGSVPLGIAAQEGHTETVQRLLEAGATVNYQNKVMTMVYLSGCYMLLSQNMYDCMCICQG